jgi:hypothetical protein
MGRAVSQWNVLQWEKLHYTPVTHAVAVWRRATLQALLPVLREI